MDCTSKYPYHLKVVNGFVRKVSKSTEGAILIYAQSLSKARLQFMLAK